MLNVSGSIPNGPFGRDIFFIVFTDVPVYSCIDLLVDCRLLCLMDVQELWKTFSSSVLQNQMVSEIVFQYRCCCCSCDSVSAPVCRKLETKIRKQRSLGIGVYNRYLFCSDDLEDETKVGNKCYTTAKTGDHKSSDHGYRGGRWDSKMLTSLMITTNAAISIWILVSKCCCFIVQRWKNCRRKASRVVKSVGCCWMVITVNRQKQAA